MSTWWLTIASGLNLRDIQDAPVISRNSEKSSSPRGEGTWNSTVCPWKVTKGPQKERIIFQPSFVRGELKKNFGSVVVVKYFWYLTCEFHFAKMNLGVFFSHFGWLPGQHLTEAKWSWRFASLWNLWVGYRKKTSFLKTCIQDYSWILPKPLHLFKLAFFGNTYSKNNAWGILRWECCPYFQAISTTRWFGQLQLESFTNLRSLMMRRWSACEGWPLKNLVTDGIHGFFWLTYSYRNTGTAQHIKIY